MEDDKDVVQFGLESIEGNLLGIILTMGIGICFRHVSDALFLWLLLFPLRKNAGGFHATTKVRCLFISTAILIISFICFTSFNATNIFYGICAIVAGCIIWFLAPVDNLSKKLDEFEHKRYQIRSRIILGAEEIIFALALYFNCEMMIRSITMALFIVSISLLMGVFSFVRRNKFKWQK